MSSRDSQRLESAAIADPVACAPVKAPAGLQAIAAGGRNAVADANDHAGAVPRPAEERSTAGAGARRQQRALENQSFPHPLSNPKRR